MQGKLVRRLPWTGISPDGVPVRAEVPVLADAQAAGQGSELLHQLRAHGWLPRAPLVAPDRDGVGGAGTEAERGQAKTARCQHGCRQSSNAIHGVLSRARPWAVTCAVEYTPRDWLPISINIDPVENFVTSGGLLGSQLCDSCRIPEGGLREMVGDAAARETLKFRCRHVGKVASNG